VAPSQPVAELVARPARGRVVGLQRVVGLADTRPDGSLRLDALARHAQDVADRDAVDAALGGRGVWLVRRVVVAVDRAPRLREEVQVDTWCSGIGPRWAERRTDWTEGGVVVVRAAALWVHVDSERRAPAPLPDAFTATWGTTAGGRRVSARLVHAPPDPRADVTAWPLRAVDLDVIGHVNNAAYWAPVEEELARRSSPRVARAELEFRAGIRAGEEVACHVAPQPDGFALWLLVAGEVRASALVGCRP
jgi:acyl-ACP thioesterase